VAAIIRFSYYFAAIATFLKFVASAPTPSSSSPGFATVDLRLTGTQNAHYTTTSQSLTSEQSHNLTIIVDQTL
jgi:hypothetical protein